MIEFAAVSKQFGKFTALDSFSVDVASGESVALWGPNGAGKTTAMKCLLDLLRYNGRIIVEGLDAHRQGREVRRRIGYVPQQISLYPELGTLETVHFFARINQASPADAMQILEQIGLMEQAPKPVGTLSGGMKQRLALGIALLGAPPILVLDEPTTNLDAESRDHFLSLLTAVRDDGKTMLFTSHRLEEVERLADRVLIMEEGRVLSEATPQKLVEESGLHTVVRLRIAQQQIDKALYVLSVQGFQVRRNGAGILVEVPPLEKALPIHALSLANVEVTDFDLLQVRSEVDTELMEQERVSGEAGGRL